MVLKKVSTSVWVFTEDAGGQAVFGVVRFLECLIERIDRGNDDERQEEFALEEIVARGKAIDDRRLDECAVGVIALSETRSTGPDRTAGRRGDRFLKSLDGTGINHRTDVDIALGRISDLERIGFGSELFDELVVDRSLNVDTAAGGALLAGEAECRAGDAIDGLVQIGVGGHDGRVLAAHLGDDRFREVGAEPLEEIEADLFGSGEDDTVDIRVERDAFSDDSAGSGQEVEDTGRNTRVDEADGQFISGAGRG